VFRTWTIIEDVGPIPGEAKGSRLASNGERPVFEVANRTYDWSDVVLAAILWGDWQKLAAETREGLACVRRLDELGLELSADELQAGANAFRSGRNLYSADELSEWLAGWGLSLSEWLDSVRRGLLRTKWAAELERVVEEHRPDDDQVALLLWIEGVCSGVLERAARRLAGRAAVAAATGSSDVDVEAPASALEQARDFGSDPKRLGRIYALEAAFARFRGGETSVDAVHKEIERNRLDWVRVEGEALAFADQDVAREAALCVREGMAFEEVARQAGVESGILRRFLEEAEAELQPHLLSATEGSLIGPVLVGEQFMLLRIQTKHVPTSEDPDVRHRAEQALLRRAVAREVAQRVRWFEAL
jgi:hypothetical protein